MKKIFTLILGLAIMHVAVAQTHSWTLPFDTDGDDEVTSVFYGNDVVVCVGEYSGTLDLDPTSYKYEITSGSGAVNGFIATYSNAGEFQSGFCFASGAGSYIDDGTTKTFQDGGVSVAQVEMGSDGNYYIAGSFYKTVDFNPNGEAKILSSPYDEDAYSIANDGFIAKYSQKGVLLWIRHIGGDEDDNVTALQLDNDDNVYAQGTYSGNVDFDRDGVGDVKSGATSNYGNNTYITKVSSDNEYDYTITMRSYNGSAAGRVFTNDFVVDKEREVMYIAGHFAYKTYFDPNSDTYYLENSRSGKYSGFIAKYDLSGNFVWASKAVDGEGKTIAKIQGIAINPDGDILEVGDFSSGSISFNGGSSISASDPSYAGHWGLFSASTGKNLWGWGITEGEEYAKFYPEQVAISPDNEIYISGLYFQTFTFKVDNASTSLTVTPSSDGGYRKYDNFLFKIDNNSVLNYLTAGGKASDSPDGGLAFGDNKELYMGGTFSGEANCWIQDENNPVTVDFNSEGGYLTCYGDAQRRSGAKKIISTTVGTIDQTNLLLEIPLNTTVVDLVAGLEVSPLASFAIYDNGVLISNDDTQEIQPSFSILVTAENETTVSYSLSVISSGVFATEIGVLDNLNKKINKIPDSTTVSQFIDGLLYSEGAEVTVYLSNDYDTPISDTAYIQQNMVLQLAYHDTTVYSLSLLQTGNDLLSTQIGKVEGDTIYCATGVDLFGFSKGIEVSEGASVVFYEDGEEITELTSATISSKTVMHIISEAEEVNIIYFVVIENAENYILSTEYGILITITSEILNIESSLTVGELLNGLTLSEKAEASVIDIVNDTTTNIIDADALLREDYIVRVESVSGENRDYTFKNMVSGIEELLFAKNINVFYNKDENQLYVISQSEANIESLSLFDLKGRQLINRHSSMSNEVVERIILENGIYVVVVQGARGDYVSRKIIVK